MKKIVTIFLVFAVVLMVFPFNNGDAADEILMTSKPEIERTWQTIDGKPHNNFDTLSENWGESCNPSIAVDSEGNVHIAWQDSSYDADDKFDIIYVMWNGQDWLTASGEKWDPKTGNGNVSQNNGNSFMPQILIDSKDRPHIVWKDGSFHEKYNDSHFTNFYHVYLVDTSWCTVEGEKWDPDRGNGFILPTFTNLYEKYRFVFRLDSKDQPYIVWDNHFFSNTYDKMRDGSGICLLRWNGESWVNIFGKLPSEYFENTRVSGEGSRPQSPDFILDKDNIPHIVWTDSGYANPTDCNRRDDDCKSYSNELVYVKLDGEDWVTSNGEIFDPETDNGVITKTKASDERPDISIDLNGFIHIAWDIPGWGDEGTDGYCHIVWDGGKWIGSNGEEFDPENFSTYFPSYGRDREIDVVFDGTGRMHVICETDGTFYASDSNAIWKTASDEIFDFELRNGIIPGEEWGFSDTKLVFDNSGIPHFVSCVAGEIVYLTHDEENWLNESGEKWEPDSDRGIIDFGGKKLSGYEMKLDDEGNLHLITRLLRSYIKENGEKYNYYNLYYMIWNGRKWVNCKGEEYDPSTENTNITPSKKSISEFDFELDSEGNPHIVFKKYFSGGSFDESHENIFYIHLENGKWLNYKGEEWVAKDLNANITNKNYKKTIGRLDLRIDSNDAPHILWQDAAYDADVPLMYIRLSDNQWANSSGEEWNGDEPNAAVFKKTPHEYDFELDSNDRPHIVWVNQGNQRFEPLSYIKFDGEKWVTFAGVEFIENEDRTSNAEILHNYLGVPDLLFGSDGNPRILMTNEGWNGYGFHLSYAEWNGEKWVTVDDKPFAANMKSACFATAYSESMPSTDFALDKDDNPHVSWSANMYSDIFYIRWDGEDWITAEGQYWNNKRNHVGNVSNSSNFETYASSLVLDDEGSPYIMFLDYSYGRKTYHILKNLDTKDKLSDEKPIEIREMGDWGVIQFWPKDDIEEIMDVNTIKFNFRNKLYSKDDYVFKSLAVHTPSHFCQEEGMKFVEEFLGLKNYDEIDVTNQDDIYEYYIVGATRRDGSIDNCNGFIYRHKMGDEYNELITVKDGVLGFELAKNGYVVPELKSIISAYSYSYIYQLQEYSEAASNSFLENSDDSCLFGDIEVFKNCEVSINHDKVEFDDTLREANVIELKFDVGEENISFGNYTVSDEDGNELKLPEISSENTNDGIIKFKIITYKNPDSEPEATVWEKSEDSTFITTIDSNLWFDKANKGNLGVESLFIKNENGQICNWSLNTNYGVLKNEKIVAYIEDLYVKSTNADNYTERFYISNDFTFSEPESCKHTTYVEIEDDFEFSPWIPSSIDNRGELEEKWSLDVGTDDFNVENYKDCWVIDTDQQVFIDPETGDKKECDYKNGFVDYRNEYVLDTKKDDDGNNIWVMSDFEGEKLWQTVLPPGEVVEPFFSFHYMYVMLKNLGLYMIDLKTGEVRWHLKNVSMENCTYNDEALSYYYYYWIICKDTLSGEKRLYRLDIRSGGIIYADLDNPSAVQSMFGLFIVYDESREYAYNISEFDGKTYFETKISDYFEGAKFCVDSNNEMPFLFEIDGKKYIYTFDMEEETIDKFEIGEDSRLVPMKMRCFQLHKDYEFRNFFYIQTEEKLFNIDPYGASVIWSINTEKFDTRPELLIADDNGILFRLGTKIVCYGEKSEE